MPALLSEQWLPWKYQPLMLLLCMVLYVMEHPLGPTCVPSQPLARLQPTHCWGAEWETRKVLVFCKHCSAGDRAPVCCQHWWSPKSETWHHGAAKKRSNSILAVSCTWDFGKESGLCQRSIFWRQQELGSRIKRLHNASQKGSRKTQLAADLDTKPVSAIPAVILFGDSPPWYVAQNRS